MCIEVWKKEKKYADPEGKNIFSDEFIKTKLSLMKDDNLKLFYNKYNIEYSKVV